MPAAGGQPRSQGLGPEGSVYTRMSRGRPPCPAVCTHTMRKVADVRGALLERGEDVLCLGCAAANGLRKVSEGSVSDGGAVGGPGKPGRKAAA